MSQLFINSINICAQLFLFIDWWDEIMINVWYGWFWKFYFFWGKLRVSRNTWCHMMGLLQRDKIWV